MNDVESKTVDRNMIITSRRPIAYPKFCEAIGDSVPIWPTNSSNNHKYAICSAGEVLLFRKSGLLIKRLSVSFQVRKLQWIEFKGQSSGDEAPQMFLTVIGDYQIFFYSDIDGSAYDHDIPFKVRDVYPTSYGLIIERNWSSDEEYKKNSTDFVYLYSLAHPLDDIMPIIYRMKDIPVQWWFCWEKEEMSVVCGVNDCLLVYDRRANVHRLFKVKRSAKNETRSAARIRQKHEETKKLAHHGATSTRFGTPGAPVSTPQSAMKTCVTRAMSVQTRSMMRLTNTKKISVASPGLLSGNSHCNDSSHLSFRMRGFSLASNANVHISRMLEREPENEMMLADLCLECIWSEPHRKETSMPAVKGFVSKSLINQIYLNYVSFSGQYLRCIRLTDRREGGPLATVGSVLSVSCLDAVYVKDEGTVVLEITGSLALYSASTRIALIVTPTDQIPRNLKLFENVDSSVVLTEDHRSWHRLDLPPLCKDNLAREMLNVIVDALPIEKANKMVADWRVRTQSPVVVDQSQQNRELHEFLNFLLRIVGISVQKHPFIAQNSSMEAADDTVVNAKLRRPRTSTEDLFERYSALDSSTASDLDVYERPLGQVKLALDPSAEFYESAPSIMIAVHAKLNEWNMFIQTKYIVNILTYYVHVMALALGNEAIKESCEKQCGIPPFELEMDKAGVETVSTKKSEKAFLLDEMLLSYFQPETDISVYPSNTFAPKANRLLLGLAVGFGKISSQTDLTKLFGKNWAKKLRLKPRKQDCALDIINSIGKRHSLKCAELLQLFEFTSYELSMLNHTIGLYLGYIILGDHTASDILFGKQKRPVAVPCRSELDEVARLKWPVDRRMCNATEMLDSSQPVLINMQFLSNELPPSATDQDLRDTQETFLSGTCIRYLVQAFGRSMLDFRTEAPLPTETYTVPNLCLSARLYPLNVVFEIPMSDLIKPYRDWGEFYNGIAAGLRVAHSSEITLDNQWLIRMTKDTNDEGVTNPDSTPTCAGLLFGFGLNGHLKRMNMYHIHDVLTQLEEFTSIGLLLGYAASNIGTADYKIHKILSTQLPFLMGPTMMSLTVPSQVQTAALSALGLLYAGTGHYNLATKIVNEIGKSAPPEESPAIDRPAYKLSAGFAAGLICLGKGDDLLHSEPPFSNDQPSLIKRLSALLTGGPRSHCVYPCPPVREEPNPFIDNGATVESNGPSSHVYENECVNVHLTSHPACIALGLMFLKSGNEEIATKLELPDTLTDLEKIRPDIILARALCRNLILWDEIKPSADWVENQVPQVIRKYLGIVFNWPEAAPREDQVGVDVDAHYDNIFDRQFLAEVYYYTVAGACFALALRYCTAPDSLRGAVFEILEGFCRQVHPQVGHNAYSRMRSCADQNASSLCLSTIILCMSLVCVGSGNMRSVQYSRYLRIYEDVLLWIRSGRKHYEQLTSHMAIGLQFLGRGRYAFKDDSLSIALMVIAMYPVPAHHIADNRYYHQPLRFLWTLATEPRLLTPVCVNTGRVSVVNIRLVHQNGETEIAKGPLLLPPLNALQMVEVAFEEDVYQPVVFDLSRKDVVEELREILHFRHGRVAIHPMTSKTCGGPSSYVLPTMEALLRGVYSDIPATLRVPGTYRMVDPILSSDPARSIRWDEMEIIPNMRMYLVSLQRELLDSRSAFLKLSLHLMRVAGKSRIEQQMLTELDKGVFPDASLYDVAETIPGPAATSAPYAEEEYEQWYERMHFNSPPIFLP